MESHFLLVCLPASNTCCHANVQLLVRRHGEKYMDMYEVYDHWHYVESMLVTDSKFGSVIVALGFVDWIFPEGTDQRIDYRVKYGRFQSDL